MNRFRELLRRLDDDEDGFAFPFVAMLLVVLLGVSAFAVDLGWLYLNSSRVQRAADSSALAAVVFLPHDIDNVVDKAVDGANANGWDVGTVNGNSVGTGPDVLNWSELPDNRLQVTLSTEVPTFFLRVLGFDDIGVSRTATAQYIKPVPLGAPANCIGIGQSVSDNGLPNSADDAFDRCNDFTQNFWAAINGRRTGLENGDPYAPTCGQQCPGSNPDHSPDYYFAVDVPAGAGNWVDVFLYDAGFYDRDNFAQTGDEENLVGSSTGGTNMTYALFRPDATPGIPEDNNTPVSCSSGVQSRTINSEDQSGTYRNRWSRLCRIAGGGDPVEGIYILKVSNGGNNIGGSNSFSILVNSQNFDPADVPRVYSLNSMSIFTNDDSGSATVYIAEVDPVHKNKTLELRFYDPGEGAGNAFMTVVPPPGAGSYSCSWSATNGDSDNTCSIQTTVGGTAQFNGEWITMQIQLGSNYNCTSDCFWKMDLDLNVSHDRTTWEARVLGNPVALVPNE